MKQGSGRDHQTDWENIITDEQNERIQRDAESLLRKDQNSPYRKKTWDSIPPGVKKHYIDKVMASDPYLQRRLMATPPTDRQ